MPATISVRLRTAGLGLAAVAIQKNAAELVRKTCIDIERDAEMDAHVITGGMKASVYVIIQGVGGQTVVNNYMESASRAKGLNPSAYIEPEALPDSGKIQGVVGVAVNYAQYEEIARGHKFLLPAAMRNEPKFVAAMATIAENV